MGKRPRVPAALHSELSEYSSLLRALRTSNTLDLASQLAAPPPTLVSSHNPDDEADDDESERPSTESVIASVDGSQASSGKARGKARAKKDYWTRWPLLAGDVHVPEWSLEDEVKLLALNALQKENSTTNSLSEQQKVPTGDITETPDPAAGPSRMRDESQEREPSDIADDAQANMEYLLTPQFLAGLSSSSGDFMTRILALLAAYVPPGEQSMQNRVHPIGWQSVLDIAGVHGLVDQEMLERVKQRLLALYPSSPVGLSHTFSDDESLRRACAAYDDSYLRIDGYTPEAVRYKQKRGPYKKHKARSTTEPESGDERRSLSKHQKSGDGEGSVLRVAETYLSYLRATALADTLALSDYPTTIYASWLQKY
ncbi:hypothetical protein NM688_g9396 [Phlebia brevispora]|uniref:Uncharacterized protein n=1 Tax=Phlebia brevispora TaxID=194682 RepID=A0ACC1RJQ1_9APHY|nr:hypothetical protein NM688_g9396 [Phlebia brevispora]